MSIALGVLATAAGVVAVADWHAVATGRRRVEWVCKPLTLALLICAAALLHPEVATRRDWFVAGLAFSLVGDVLLMLPRDLFVGGLASFLAGHVCYIVGLTRHGGSAATIAITAIFVAAIGAAPATRILPAVRRRDPKMVGPVTAYMIVISAMVATAAATGIWLAGIGAALFYVSDASIAWDRFVAPWSWARTWIMVTYHLGQAGLVLSLAR